MPTQHSNFTAETRRDIAGLGTDASVALAQDAADDVLAAVRPNAAIAARDDALSEKDAAGPPVASTRSVFDLLRRYWLVIQTRRQRHRSRATLRNLTERELMDIGITSSEIECIVAHRAADRQRDGMTRLWMHSGT
ncbi:DUF1127 domain-containing protein [Tardiphaga sp. 37S4]|uniref:DUF1127 domain-containing protein n=1 Tax=Tardiphaga sp. 37S4 TaxID=1404741 RepID=UPI001E55CFB8|nr:DUF1127 domain-containing protein [Tardiphaga sp. 37S4]UFS78125.1 DUF1127 domain-containing protein [Tardiphaga sp. 37S4]